MDKITLISITAAAYFLLGSFQWLRMANKPYPPKSVSQLLLFATLAVHFFLLYSLVEQGVGQNLSLFNMMTMILWLVTLMIFVAAFRMPVQTYYALVLPLTGFSLILAYALPSETWIITGQDPMQLGHILLSILAYSLLTIGAIQALFMSLQERLLRKHPPSRFFMKMPPLQTMEGLLFHFIWSGFLTLTAALISGFIFLEDILRQNVAHKIVFSIVAWGIYAILLWGRHQRGWRGLKAVHWALGGFACLLIAYFGSKFVIEWLLSA